MSVIQGHRGYLLNHSNARRWIHCHKNPGSRPLLVEYPERFYSPDAGDAAAACHLIDLVLDRDLSALEAFQARSSIDCGLSGWIAEQHRRHGRQTLILSVAMAQGVTCDAHLVEIIERPPRVRVRLRRGGQMLSEEWYDLADVSADDLAALAAPAPAASLSA